jgi:hypothetical protein
MAVILWFSMCGISITILGSLSALDPKDHWKDPIQPGILRTGHHWCEGVDATNFIRSPFSAYTNLPFIFYGWAVIVIAYCTPVRDQTIDGGHHYTNHLVHCRWLNIMQGMALLWLGVGSFYCHAAATLWSRELDRSGMWAAVLFPCAYLWLRLFNCPAAPERYLGLLGRYLVLFVLVSLYHMAVPVSSNGTQLGLNPHEVVNTWLYGGIFCMLTFVYIEKFYQHCINWLFAKFLTPQLGWLNQTTQINSSNYLLVLFALLCAIIAFFCQDASRFGSKKFCDPQLPWYRQGHGYWHILMATTLFSIWLFFWTEGCGNSAPDDKVRTRGDFQKLVVICLSKPNT